MRIAERQRLEEIASRFRAVIVISPGDEAGTGLAGISGFSPRPVSLELPVAEANPPGRRIQGLVVNPAIHPMVFKRRRRYANQDAWDRFLGTQGATSSESLNALQSGGASEFSIDMRTESPRYGALRRNGRYLHDVHEIVDAQPLHEGAGRPRTGIANSLGAAFAPAFDRHTDGPLLAVAPPGLPGLVLDGLRQLRAVIAVLGRLAQASYAAPPGTWLPFSQAEGLAAGN